MIKGNHIIEKLSCRQHTLYDCTLSDKHTLHCLNFCLACMKHSFRCPFCTNVFFCFWLELTWGQVYWTVVFQNQKRLPGVKKAALKRYTRTVGLGFKMPSEVRCRVWILTNEFSVANSFLTEFFSSLQYISLTTFIAASPTTNPQLFFTRFILIPLLIIVGNYFLFCVHD